MPKIIFFPGGECVEAPFRARLMEACEENAAPLSFGCGVAACGSCRIRVISQPENLSELTQEEQDYFDRFGRAADERLACQCRVLGDVTISPPA